MTSATTFAPLNILYQKHRQELITHLYKIVQCEHTAEDLMQETMLRFAGYESDEPMQHPRAFLYRTATNLALDYLRRQKLRNHLDLSEIPDGSQPIALYSPEDEVFDIQRFEIFMEALDSLPPRCRQVFILHRLHHLSYADIACRLGISQSAVEKHIIRALSKCHVFLKNKGIAPW